MELANGGDERSSGATKPF